MGKDVRRERRSQEEDIRGLQSSVQIPPMSRGDQESLGLSSVPNKDPAGPVHQVGHVNQQVDRCQDGYNQSLVPDAHQVGELMVAAHITGPLGLATKILVELVEQPEDQSAGIEEDGEQGQPQQESGEANGQLVAIASQIQQEGHSPQEEADGVHGHTPHQGRLVQVQGGVADEGKDDTGHEVL